MIYSPHKCLPATLKIHPNSLNKKTCADLTVIEAIVVLKLTRYVPFKCVKAKSYDFTLER